ncbi:hypothetical protein K8B33_03015 [Alcanivorax sp. JB21]|uniref:hypothetical protein n=1 Tax=Alcanivorax limicola TaxID=2874102 RepID=UPI001CBAEA20|nr:hypothetical protein [Alcanivorax limicola]MBZ2188054.1 hypothetical protein [Alcanivorax limicola]
MSRMVRESGTSGLRERLWFARESLTLLRQAKQNGAAPGQQLALRGAVIFHAYSVLVGLVRQAAKSYSVAGCDPLLSLAALEAQFRAADVESPELNLVARARADQRDPLAWLDAQVMGAFGAAGMARRPQPQAEQGQRLAIAAEDPYAPLADGDLSRLAAAIDRVAVVLEESAPYSDEW